MNQSQIGKIELNKIYNLDCILGMRQLENDYIATCITDPPYNYEFVGRNWNNDEIERRINRIKKEENTKTLVRNLPYGSGLSGGVRNKRWYEKNRQNIIGYSEWIEAWGKELYRIMKPGGLVLVFNSTRTIAQVQVALEKCGFYARDIIVWRRNSGIPKGNNISKKMEKLGDTDYEKWSGWHSCLRTEWEAISVVQKPLIDNYYKTLKEYNVGLFHAEQGNGFQSNIIENIKRDEKDEFNKHITVKPIDLIQKLILLTTPKVENNIIIDPFMGSGTTAVAAQKLNYNFIGFEISKEYVEISNKRLIKGKNNND